MMNFALFTVLGMSLLAFAVPSFSNDSDDDSEPEQNSLDEQEVVEVSTEDDQPQEPAPDEIETDPPTEPPTTDVEDDDQPDDVAPPAVATSGDDSIQFDGVFSTFDAGAGDDTITSNNASASTILGGDGDDLFTGFLENTDAVTFDGGAGNDTLIGSDLQSAQLQGGDGNDLLVFGGTSLIGAGYVVVANGGPDDDTIRFSGSAITDEYSGPNVATGGEGSDTFEISIDEGGGYEDAFPSTRPEQSDGALLLDSVVISDFETGVDQLVVDADATSDGYSLTTARFEIIEDRNGLPENNLVLRYESETEVARDVAINLGTSTLTWNDVAFVGETTPQLVAL